MLKFSRGLFPKVLKSGNLKLAATCIVFSMLKSGPIFFSRNWTCIPTITQGLQSLEYIKTHKNITRIRCYWTHMISRKTAILHVLLAESFSNWILC